MDANGVSVSNTAGRFGKQRQKRPLADGGFTFTSLKNDKIRIIKPVPFVMEMLSRRKLEQERQKIHAAEA